MQLRPHTRKPSACRSRLAQEDLKMMNWRKASVNKSTNNSLGKLAESRQ